MILHQRCETLLYMNLRKIKCKLELHKWKQSNKLTLYDISPGPFDSNYQTPTRTCEKCDKKQRWLPGYGGSEIGCWLSDN